MRYAALIHQENGSILAEFPDCPGCQTFAERGQAIEPVALEALMGWLETVLQERDVPPEASVHLRAPEGHRVLWVTVPAQLATKISLRQARARAGVTPGELAKRAGVTQAVISQLEHPDSNPTIETLEKVARALGAELRIERVARRPTKR